MTTRSVEGHSDWYDRASPLDLGPVSEELPPQLEEHTTPMGSTLLETAFPFRQLSLIIKADRRARDPIYGVHRWWARRPPALLRGMLIASHLRHAAAAEKFWSAFGSEDRPLTGQRVLDPFAGGGSTLVEAARLGAHVVGSDIDPLAVRIIGAELQPPDQQLFRDAGQTLLKWLAEEFSRFYPSASDGAPLHYFYIPIVKCPSCRFRGPLYRNLVLARDMAKRGAVVRESPLTCYCPACFSLHHFKKPDAKRLTCCGRQWSISSGTYIGRTYRCPECGTKSTHRDLQTGTARQQLIAVEEVPSEGHRILRTPATHDTAALRRAKRALATKRGVLHLPLGSVLPGHRDDRPISYGMNRYEDLFTARQLIVFGSAWKWLSSQGWPTSIASALSLALSNALATNNRLCGYATDYGRISALFAVRGYSLPALAIELNPVHPTGGRGTIAACISRIERASTTSHIRRYTWSIPKRRPVPIDIKQVTTAVQASVTCNSADTVHPYAANLKADICIFDPPYYDYIAYDELSAFFRAWQENSELAGVPLLPSNKQESFGSYLGRCLSTTLHRVHPRHPIAFTYHSTNPEAWEAIGEALDLANLRITAIWPVRSDGHMGHHSHEGNTEWDLVIACRRYSETRPSTLSTTVKQWVAAVRPLRVSRADRLNMSLALKMAMVRFAALQENV